MDESLVETPYAEVKLGTGGSDSPFLFLADKHKKRSGHIFYPTGPKKPTSLLS